MARPERLPSSPRSIDQAARPASPLSSADDLPDWRTIWAGCARRLRAWRPPPRWSTDDWFEEVEAVATAAAWQALRDFDPGRGVPLEAFVRLRIFADVRGRYRQEWAFAVRFGVELGSAGGGAPLPEKHTDPGLYDALRSPLAKLAELDRLVIEHLFWDGQTQAQIAAQLGVSQQAVSKRKRHILLGLRRSIRSSKAIDEEDWL